MLPIQNTRYDVACGWSQTKSEMTYVFQLQTPRSPVTVLFLSLNILYTNGHNEHNEVPVTRIGTRMIQIHYIQSKFKNFKRKCMIIYFYLCHGKGQRHTFGCIAIIMFFTNLFSFQKNKYHAWHFILCKNETEAI